jgi:hypothetical protein
VHLNVLSAIIKHTVLQADVQHSEIWFPPCALPLAACCWWPAGITLSHKQVQRGMQLAAERGLTNVKFMVRHTAHLKSACSGTSARQCAKLVGQAEIGCLVAWVCGLLKAQPQPRSGRFSTVCLCTKCCSIAYSSSGSWHACFQLCICWCLFAHLTHRVAQVADVTNAMHLVNTLCVQVMDALNMEFADDSFDFVWACESGEHMPDKKAYVEEMARVLAPGGKVR